MEEADKGWLMTTIGLSGECFFWYRLTRVVPNKIWRAVKWLYVCGKQWYQLPEFIPSNSGLHSCMSIPLYTQHVTHTPHTTCHLNNKTCVLTPLLHWHHCLYLCILYWLLVSCNLYKEMTSSLCTCYLLYHYISYVPTSWIITSVSTTDATLPSYSLLRYLLLFSTNHKLGLIHIFSHAMLFFHSLCLLIRSSSVLSIITKSSAYNNLHGKVTLNSLDRTSLTKIKH